MVETGRASLLYIMLRATTGLGTIEIHTLSACLLHSQQQHHNVAALQEASAHTQETGYWGLIVRIRPNGFSHQQPDSSARCASA